RLGVRRASFAPPEVTRDLTGMQIGGVTPLALPQNMPLWIDSRVMDRETIVVGGGSRSCKVVGPPRMLLALPNAEVVTDLARPTAH
ncbi:MAG: YbaK/EbsC family protein, partial [Jiangellales bacterium]